MKLNKYVTPFFWKAVENFPIVFPLAGKSLLLCVVWKDQGKFTWIYFRNSKPAHLIMLRKEKEQEPTRLEVELLPGWLLKSSLFPVGALSSLDVSLGLNPDGFLNKIHRLKQTKENVTDAHSTANGNVFGSFGAGLELLLPSRWVLRARWRHMLRWVCERRWMIPPRLRRLFVLVRMDSSVAPLTRVNVVPLAHRKKTRPLTVTKVRQVHGEVTLAFWPTNVLLCWHMLYTGETSKSQLLKDQIKKCHA